MSLLSGHGGSPELKDGRLVIVSNRLPVSLRQEEHGEWSMESGSGGLVTAMAPILRDRGGLWVGWPGASGAPEDEMRRLLAAAGATAGYELAPIPLTAEEEKNYYYGFSNEILWPLFHDLQPRCNMNDDYWDSYQRVNRKFASAIVDSSGPNDPIWIHDYHLMLVANVLRSMGIQRRISFFLHIPFPSPDIFRKLPWRKKLLRALLDYDLIGFQTPRDRKNFVDCVRSLMKDVSVRGRGRVLTVPWSGRGGKVGVFPISIDSGLFSGATESEEVKDRAWFLHEDLPERHIVLSVDRLDYTKGIPQRLEAIRSALKLYPSLIGNVTFVQVVVPSRRDIPEYEELKAQIERMVGEINGEFTRSGWVPIHYLFRSLTFQELVAYYRTAEIMLVTPLKDGMNLVAKEYCAANADESGVLILSEFAGAAAQLKRGALLVNPHDPTAIAKAIERAVHMDEKERRSRMSKMRRSIAHQDVFWWVDAFLHNAVDKDLNAFPRSEEAILHEPAVQEPSIPG